MPRPYVGREGVSDAYLSKNFVECSGEISVAPQSIRHTLWMTWQCRESIYYPNSAISRFNQWEISDGDKVFRVRWFVFLLPLLSVSDGEQEEGKHASNMCQSQPSNTTHICLQSTSGFDTSSRRYCATCCMDVKIAFGGEANWDIHVKSAAHVWSGQAASQKASALHFFSNFITKAPSRLVLW